MRPRSRSSRRWSTRCSHDTILPLEKKPKKWLSHGLSTSIMEDDVTGSSLFPVGYLA